MNINRIGMYGIEIDNFFNSDNKEYILEKNQEFINWYNQKLNEGFHSILTPKQIQHMIEKIVLFFEFKYHNKFLIECIKSEKSEEYYKSREIAKKMDMEELKYRLHHDYLQFLNCSYASTIILKKKKENPWDVSMEVITLDADGIINEYDLENLKESNYVQSIEGIETASDLLTYFLSNPTTVNYS